MIVHVYGFLLNVNLKRNAIVAKSYDMSFFIIGIHTIIEELLPHQHDAIFIVLLLRFSFVVERVSSFGQVWFYFWLFTFSTGSDWLTESWAINKESKYTWFKRYRWEDIVISFPISFNLMTNPLCQLFEHLSYSFDTCFNTRCQCNDQQRECVKAKKKVLVLWCTYFLLLTFSVHFVVRKRMLILNAPSLFFTELFELTLLFSFFNAPCHLFTKTVNVSSNHWPTRTSFVVLSIVKKSHAHTITTSVLSFIFIRDDLRCRFSKYPLLSTKIWNNTFFLSSLFHWSVIFRSLRNVTVGFLQKDS